MIKFFNTAGPVNPEDHYCLKPLSRFNLEELLFLIAQKKYFVLHAPRQTGKTSCMLALMDYLNRERNYHCLYVNVEGAQAARGHVADGIQAILAEMASQSQRKFQDLFLAGCWKPILQQQGPHQALNETLSQWTQHALKPTVLILDEIDALVGDTLISVLRQLRAGYTNRPQAFPQSVILCGVRDVRDYRIHSATQEIITGGSAFNIKAESLRLGNFNKEDIQTLYAQHTETTGQRFEADTLALVWHLTQGQPWLVNALGYEVCSRTPATQDRSIAITVEMIQEAKENLILRRETHLDQLTDKLQEDRVRRVIQPILSGIQETIPPQDSEYVLDLGLISRARNGEIQIANAIYQEVIPRELAWSSQTGIAQQTSWYVRADGSLDFEKLLKAFQEFFREHSEHWVERFAYKEAGPQLLMQAFLQRIVNGGGRIEREYGLGRKRTDLLVIWPYPEGCQKVVIELKILYQSLEATIKEGLKQTWEYLDTAGTKEGHLLIFDRTPDKSWEEKIFRKRRSYQKTRILVWGL